MPTHQDNFRTWFAKPLARLYHDPDAGFIIVMTAFPLLERYLRQKATLTPQDDLSDDFYDALMPLFPALYDLKTAKEFWAVYRNGLLHQGTFSTETKKKVQLPPGWFTNDTPAAISINATDGSFWVHPRKFAEKVLHEIDNNFLIYEGAASAAPPLPTVKQRQASDGTITTGTSGKP